MTAADLGRTAVRVAETPRPHGIHPPELHLWAMSFGQLEPRFDVLRSLLSEDEHRRAERYRRLDDRRRFILGRGQLRTLLEIYTGVPAQSFVFSYGPFGKPELGRRPSAQDVRFSLSHTSEMIVYLFGHEHDVGIDIESDRHQGDHLTGRSSFLSPRESLLIQEAAEEKRDEMFLSFWTRKEACLKALGTGFSMAANTMDVSMAPLVRITHDASRHSETDGIMLCVSDFCIGEAYRGAIASRADAIPNVVLRAIADHIT